MAWYACTESASYIWLFMCTQTICKCGALHVVMVRVSLWVM